MENQEPAYLNFDEPICSDSGATTISEEKEEEIGFTEEDFAKLARQADGFTTPNDPILPREMEANSSPSTEMETDEEGVILAPQAKKINSPYLKILVAIILTSAFAICLFILRSSWLRITNIAQTKTPRSAGKTISALEKHKFEIDRLKAELATIEQGKKPLPSPKPQPQPEPQPEPKPKSQPQPAPRPEPTPTKNEIDPHEQWELLAQLGTLGGSDMGRSFDSESSVATNRQRQKTVDSTRSAEISLGDRAVPAYTEGKSPLSSLTAEGYKRLSLTPRLEEEKTPNRIASLELSNSYFNPRRPSDTKLQSKRKEENNDDDSDVFSPEAKQVILDGLGVDRAELATPEISSATSIKGTLENPLVWTNDSKQEDTRAQIILSEPINDSNGNQVIPQGSSMIVEVASWSDAGFVTLDARALYYEDRNQQLRQIELEPDSVLVRAEDNRPLAFEIEQNNNNQAMELLGDLVKEGSRSLPVPRGIGNRISHSLNSNQSRRSRINNIYFVPAGTPVSISVNSLNLEDHE